MSEAKLPTVFWVGDSIALHYQPYLRPALANVARLEFRQGYREAIKDLDHPRGANCGDSSMVLAFLQKLLAGPSFDAEWIVFNCGLHDIKTEPMSGMPQVEIGVYQKNLTAMVDLIRRHGRRAGWITTTPVDDQRHRAHCEEIRRYESDVLGYNARAAQVMKERMVPVLDLHGFTAGLNGELYCDHVHYVEEVQKLQAEFLAGEFQAWLLRAPADGRL